MTGPGETATTAMLVWRDADGSPISCLEKLKVLRDNHEELAQIMRDAFEDAILMGVDEDAMRQMLADMVAGLRSPKRARPS